MLEEYPYEEEIIKTCAGSIESSRISTRDRSLGSRVSSKGPMKIPPRKVVLRAVGLGLIVPSSRSK